MTKGKIRAVMRCGMHASWAHAGTRANCTGKIIRSYHRVHPAREGDARCVEVPTGAVCVRFRVRGPPAEEVRDCPRERLLQEWTLVRLRGGQIRGATGASEMRHTVRRSPQLLLSRCTPQRRSTEMLQHSVGGAVGANPHLKGVELEDLVPVRPLLAPADVRTRNRQNHTGTLERRCEQSRQNAQSKANSAAAGVQCHYY